MDTREVGERLEQGPTLLHWVARAKKGISLQSAGISEDIFGLVTPMQRGDLNWLITVPYDGHLPADGVLPTLIDWGGAPHPTTKLPDRGLKLVKLRGFHPRPEEVRGVLTKLGLEGVIELREGEVGLEADTRNIERRCDTPVGMIYTVLCDVLLCRPHHTRAGNALYLE